MDVTLYTENDTFKSDTCFRRDTSYV